MSVSKIFHKLKTGRDNSDSEDTLKSSWENILLQIALPIVLILAFTSLTKLSSTVKDYRQKKEQLNTMIAQYEEKREKIARFLNELENTPLKEQIEKRTEAVIDLQKQKIIKALGELRYDEKIQSGIYLPTKDVTTQSPRQWRSEAYLRLFPVANITIHEGILFDEGWKDRFNRIYNIVHNENSQRLVAFDYYGIVLEKAGLEDKSLNNVTAFLKEIEKTTDELEQTADALNDPHSILPDNRIFAWKEIQEFLREIENDTVILQREILNRIIDYYIEYPDDLDRLDAEGIRIGELKRLIKEFSRVDRKLRREQRNRILSMIEHIFHYSLDDRGYRFLDKTWEYHKS